MFSPLEQFDAIPVWGGTLVNCTCPFKIMWNVLMPLIMVIAFFLRVASFKHEFTMMPKPLQSIFESIMEFMFNLMKQQIGSESYMLSPFIFTLFNFILLCNLLSLMPFGIALTSHLMMMLWLSLTLSLGMFILGLRIHNMSFLSMFMPECPLILLPMLMGMEMFSYVIKSFSLAIRLSANMMAGHTLVHMMSAFMLQMTAMEFWFMTLGFVFISAVLMLEFGVAFLQAYVFTVLVCIYMNDSFNPSH